jgi:DNA polymerase III subunit alpha
MLSAVRPKIAKTGRSAGQKWAILELEDLEGKIEAMCFAEAYAAITARAPQSLRPEHIVFIRGKVDRRRETPCLVVNDVIPIESAIEKLTSSMGVKLEPPRHGIDVVKPLRDVLGKHPGKRELFVQVSASGGRKVSLKVNGEHGVRITRELVDDLELVLGSGAVQLSGEGSRRMKRLAQQQLFKEEAVELGAIDEALAEESAIAE